MLSMQECSAWKSRSTIMHTMVALLMLLGSTLLFYPQTASAGSNGQQVQVTFRTTYGTTCGTAFAKSVSVSGTNHNGAYVTWRTSVTPMYCGNMSVITTNWWFKGNVRVVVNYQSSWASYNRVCDYYIPTSYSSNIYPVTC